jgi:membrane protease YdiL (CAAX protease family)
MPGDNSLPKGYGKSIKFAVCKFLMMTRSSFFPHTRPGYKIFWLLFMVVLSMLVFSVLGLLAGVFLFGYDLSSIGVLVAHPDHSARPFLYTFQVINQLGIFILPSFLFAYLFSNHSGEYLKLGKTPVAAVFVLAALSIYTVLPFINWLTEINMQMTFPQWLTGVGDWMKSKETQADLLTRFFLSVKSPGGLLINIVVIALIPAIGEELLFRGLLQRLLNEWTRSIPAGVILTAFIFSAIHMQFFGFLPRFLLGLMLGLMLEYTQSLWVPVTAHFINNATLVILFYLHYNGYIAVEADHFGTSHSAVIILLSLLLTSSFFVWIKRWGQKNPSFLRG